MERLLIETKSTLAYDLAMPTTFILNIAPAVSERQTVVREQLEISSAIPYDWCDTSGERFRSLRLSANPGPLEVHYAATIELKPEADETPQLRENTFESLPATVLRYLNPSRYCESDLLHGFAAKEFGNTSKGFARVKEICDWTHSHIDYVIGTTDASTTACDVLLQRTGVCRDFAHVGVALCRALGIPARYVAGYAPGLSPPDFHGLFEAFLGGRWYLFDATRMAGLGSFVRIGVGRDAADVPVATIVGQAVLQNKEVSAVQLGEGGQAPIPPELAISTA